MTTLMTFLTDVRIETTKRSPVRDSTRVRGIIGAKTGRIPVVVLHERHEPIERHAGHPDGADPMVQESAGHVDGSPAIARLELLHHDLALPKASHEASRIGGRLLIDPEKRRRPVAFSREPSSVSCDVRS